jgi:hypothetical protein
VEKLEAQFEGALTRIEVTGPMRARAIKAHEEIRDVLKRDPLLTEWGIAPVLIGSYARETGIYPGKDVDVFARLGELNTQNIEPAQVYNAVRDVLVSHYGDRATPQARSIKVGFDTDGDRFSVDVVPAVRMGGRWGIPRRKTELWASPRIEERWVETDPEQLGKLTVERNKSPKVGSQGAYVPTVKLLRQARRQHRGAAKPGGFYFELLAYWAFAGDTVSGDCFAEIFAQTLRAVALQLSSGATVTDPVLGRPYRPAPDPAELVAASQAFSDLATKAEAALVADRCRAAAIWRGILGENDRGWCFGIPPGCDERGNRVPVRSGVAALGSREASPFA